MSHTLIHLLVSIQYCCFSVWEYLGRKTPRSSQNRANRGKKYWYSWVVKIRNTSGHNKPLGEYCGPHTACYVFLIFDPFPQTIWEIRKYVRYYGDQIAIILFCLFQRHYRKIVSAAHMPYTID